jgi:hypothetical protein
VRGLRVKFVALLGMPKPLLCRLLNLMYCDMQTVEFCFSLKLLWGGLNGRVPHQGGVDKYWQWLQIQTRLNSKKNQALSLTG